ncbi:condensation domain-containing protein [Streptomyces kunmingensis]|uniref:Condensation domain-containing protein n=1 Tax=Streptomyces kunmingensis TaxID=68225 RepID=A0ABU6CBT6_9ACTN|nr:condensation domain-containing protein [Streptomyces kunmingensis]MEB3962171.1 condensation domain-containing protein [Streptomyces kunmingensis]
MSDGRPMPGGVLCVTHAKSATTPDGSHVLDLCGPLTPAEAERVADRLVERHRSFSVLFTSHTDTRHTLTLVPHDAAGAGTPLSPELLADVLLLPVGARTVPLMGAQRAQVRAAVRAPYDRGHHVEQVALRWTGPLDPRRWAAAWQSVAAGESVLRSAFDWVAAPRLVLHDRAVVDIVHRSRTEVRSWNELLLHDRARGFALDRAGLLRLTLLEDAPSATDASVPSTRVLLTYHRALLDERAVHILLRAFYRAYAVGGPLPGGERRPDARDHARWLAEQSPDAARGYWTRAAPPPDAVMSPGRPSGPTQQRGDAQIRRRLDPLQALRLRTWATGRGAGESSALHLVWALLLYRAAGARGPAHVSFGLRLAGRDVALPGASDAPGLLGGCAPLTVTVDPAQTLGALTHRLRDASLDMAAYPWVSDELLREWADGGARPADTTVDFDSRPVMAPAVRAELESQGVRVDMPRLVGGGTGPAVTLVARHEPDGALGLTSLYDRAVLGDADATLMLSQCVRLLRALADFTDEGATVAELLGVLDGLGVPGAAARPPDPPGARRASLTTLRRGEPGGDVVCLIAQEGVVPGAHDRFARLHDGPERIVELHCDGAPAELPPGLVEAQSGRLLLCGCGPGAVTAYEIARTVAASLDPVVVMAGTGSAEASADALVAGLRSVAAGST